MAALLQRSDRLFADHAQAQSEREEADKPVDEE